MVVHRFLWQGTSKIKWKLEETCFYISVSGYTCSEIISFEYPVGQIRESLVGVFAGLIPVIVLSGHSFNLVQRFSCSDTNKLLVYFLKKKQCFDSLCSYFLMLFHGKFNCVSPLDNNLVHCSLYYRSTIFT
jgi:hypothetical protein